MMHRWLAYGHNGKGAACDVTFFKRREFCFTLEGDIFARYRSYNVRRRAHCAWAAALIRRRPCRLHVNT
jgi:DNA primase small subunit